MKRFFLMTLTAACCLSALPTPALTSVQAGYAMQKITADNCENNLRQIYMALLMYSQQHQGELPAENNSAGLAQLAKFGLDSKLLYCTKHKGKAAKSWAGFSPKNCSYCYFGGFNLDQASRKVPHLPLVCDKIDNTHLLVLFANAEVREFELRTKKVKINSCRVLIEMLNALYQYPSGVLQMLREKANAIDRSK